MGMRFENTLSYLTKDSKAQMRKKHDYSKFHFISCTLSHRMKRVLKIFEEIMSDHLKGRITRVVCKEHSSLMQISQGNAIHICNYICILEMRTTTFIYEQGRLFHNTRKQKKQTHKTAISFAQSNAHPRVGFALTIFGQSLRKWPISPQMQQERACAGFT